MGFPVYFRGQFKAPLHNKTSKKEEYHNFHIYPEFYGRSEAAEEVKKLLHSCWSMWPNHDSVMYRKPNHTGRYLYCKPNHPYQVKSGIVHSSISRVKVICQVQKYFDMEIKNISHYLLLNEYPHEFVDIIMMPSRSNVLLQIEYIRARSLSQMSRVSRRN
jgi:hypothetical protein